MSRAARFVVLLWASLGTLALSAQQPTFRSSVRLVNVTVIAHDSAGRPVKDLAASDFRVFEDGKEQKLEVFAIEPIRWRRRRRVPSAPAAPARLHQSPPERTAGGVTVILFDRLNSSFEDQKNARDQILRMLAKASPRIASRYTCSSPTKSPSCTTSRATPPADRGPQTGTGHNVSRVGAIGRESARLCEDRNRLARCRDRSVARADTRRWSRRLFLRRRARAHDRRAGKHCQSSGRHSGTEESGVGVRRVSHRDS